MQHELHYAAALQNMVRTVRELEAKVPPPQTVPHKTSFVFRYIEKTVQQAIVQKLARVVSTLSGAHLLMSSGFVQEQAALQRILQELHEDIIFLAYSVIFKDFTSLHQNYLDAFYKEEFDADTAMESSQKRPMVSRTKIQAYIVRKEGSGLDPSTGLELARTITKAYSGFVHAASPQIMDMYGGNPPKFHVQGLLGSERHDEYRHDLWNYFFRSILSFGMTARVFRDQKLFDQIHAFSVKFEEAAGKSYSPKPRD
jgi:hypothetical protein